MVFLILYKPFNKIISRIINHYSELSSAPFILHKSPQSISCRPLSRIPNQNNHYQLVRYGPVVSD